MGTNTTWGMTVLAICAGQLSAIALHALAWWLRHKALWLLNLLGALGVVTAGWWMLLLLGWGYDPTNPQQQQELVIGIASFLGATSILGGLHAWQLKTRWRARLHLWPPATLAVFGEGLLAALLNLAFCYVWNKAQPRNYFAQVQFTYAFVGTLLILAVFRPIVLKFMQPFKPLLNWRKSLRALHPTVQSDS